MANGNSIRDEIKEQQQKMMQENGIRGRISYFFFYYKVHLIIALILIAVVITTVFNILTQKDVVLQVAFVNGFPNQSSEEFMGNFEKSISLDTKHQETFMDDSFYIASENPSVYDDQNNQKFLIMAGANQIDVCVADNTYFESIANAGYFTDLSTILTAEQLARYKDNLYYFDSPNDDYDGEVIAGIRVSDAAKIVSTKSFPNTDAYFGIIINSSNIENAVAFLEYLETP
ncbi:MAG: extracellular solute-binding protein [Lachnospiraceae bacterium]|nr:extracellular solute-binding protein [Lachnospiraceae bacterium]